jgi:glucuronate isomerase
MSLLNDPDRLFPLDENVRAIARDLFSAVEEAPIISPHGHVDPAILVEDRSFTDAAELFIRHDHYVTRLLHATGVTFPELGIPGAGAPASARDTWRTFCRNWRTFEGTASGYWLQSTFANELGMTEEPTGENADRLFDAIGRRLSSDDFRPRALFGRFGIEVMATTDDPLDDLAPHRQLAADGALSGRVLPTFRPDAYLDPASPGWAGRVSRLANWNGSAESSYTGYLEALRARRQYFIDHGAVSADHGVRQPLTLDLDHDTAAALFERARAGISTEDERQMFLGNMLFRMAEMSVDDGLVMTVHAGVLRNHDQPTFDAHGPDMGNDIPVTTHFVEPLQPVLQAFGNMPDFHLVLFSVDETVYSREIAPLAGYYPSVFIGAPWWFLDAPDAVQRFRAATTETAGFSRGSGFVDDTRAFLSIPARHDMARRLDAAYLARLVGEGRLSTASAERRIVDMVGDQPRKVFKL